MSGNAGGWDDAPAPHPPDGSSGGGGWEPPPPPGPPTGPPVGGPTPGPSDPSGGSFTIGEAFNYGWLKFQQHWQPIVLGLLAYVAAFVVIYGIFFGLSILFGQIVDSTNGDIGPLAAVVGTFTLALVIAVPFLLQLMLQAGVIRAGLNITGGRPVETSTLLSGERIGAVVLTVLLVSALTFVGFLLCVVPGIIVAFFTQFALFFVIDRGEGPLEAVKSSFSFVNQHLATIVLLYLASIVAYFVGALLCYLGLLVSVPVVVIAQAFTYRRLRGEPVAA